MFNSGGEPFQVSVSVASFPIHVWFCVKDRINNFSWKTRSELQNSFNRDSPFSKRPDIFNIELEEKHCL